MTTTKDTRTPADTISEAVNRALCTAKLLQEATNTIETEPAVVVRAAYMIEDELRAIAKANGVPPEGAQWPASSEGSDDDEASEAVPPSNMSPRDAYEELDNELRAASTFLRSANDPLMQDELPVASEDREDVQILVTKARAAISKARALLTTSGFYEALKGGRASDSSAA